ncbi:hypothetical protein BDR22DRAFT_321810 [Usnea florida]
MGWFWGRKLDPSEPTNNDPLRDLDPSLRDFLAKESPIRYTPAPPPPPPSPPPETNATTTTETPSSPPTPIVPPESLYQDGRYADLWANYKSLAAIEAENKSEQEKLLDVIQGFNQRKAQIGRAAVENCVEEQIAVQDCWEQGRWRDKMMMCRGENRTFERCYIMQSRFLKALGYQSSSTRPESVDEAIQMHADTLYHRMLSQETAAAEAKAAGLPEPEFAPILSSVSRSTNAKADTSATIARPKAPAQNALPDLAPETRAYLTEAAQAELRERMKGMTPVERELEEKGTLMEVRMASEAQKEVSTVFGERKKRRENGTATMGDTISGWFGW